MTAAMLGETKYDFEHLTPRGDFQAKDGRWFRLGASGGAHPVSPPTTPLDWDDHQQEMGWAEDRFCREAEQTLVRMASLSQRLGDDGMTAPEIVDTLREWLDDVITACRVRPAPVVGVVHHANGTVCSPWVEEA